MSVKKIRQTSYVLLTIILLVSALYFLRDRDNRLRNMNDVYAHMGGDFTLHSAKGPVSLSDFKGKLVILYFGYAFCPDVCPTSLGLLSLAMGKLSSAELDSIQTFFISVDPERDTVENLEKYAAAFHHKIQGITGSVDEIADVTKRYAVAFRKVEVPGSAIGYTVDHSSRYYLIDRNGRLKGAIEHGTSPDGIAMAIRKML